MLTLTPLSAESLKPVIKKIYTCLLLRNSSAASPLDLMYVTQNPRYEKCWQNNSLAKKGCEAFITGCYSDKHRLCINQKQAVLVSIRACGLTLWLKHRNHYGNLVPQDISWRISNFSRHAEIWTLDVEVKGCPRHYQSANALSNKARTKRQTVSGWCLYLQIRSLVLKNP